jgi:hypothetical protein
MSNVCDQFAEAVVTGDAVETFAPHVATCERCQQTQRAAAALQQTATAGQLRASAPDPGLGFTARITVGAQHRVVQRRRNRYIMTGAGGLAAAAALTALVISQRTPAAPVAQPAITAPAPTQPAPMEPAPADALAIEDRDNLRALVRWQATADAWQQDRLPTAARWRRTIKPVAAYQTIVHPHK